MSEINHAERAEEFSHRAQLQEETLEDDGSLSLNATAMLAVSYRLEALRQTIIDENR